MLSCSVLTYVRGIDHFGHGSTRLFAILVSLTLLIPVALIQNLVLPTLAHTPFVQAGAVNVKINFQPDSSPVPSGYTKDIGAAYDTSRGSGWVREDSLSSATHVPLDIVPNARDRNLNPDQRLDTLLHMQYPAAGSSTTAVKIPAAWEYDLANGTYTVTVAVGDPAVGTDPESHVINVEGVRAINNFVPRGTAGSDTRHLIATITVNVSDGKLTIDATGGTNTKIDYVDITGGPVTPVDLNVNFQSQTAPVPTNYLRDFGESYGLRTGANQGSGLSYGWVVPGSTTPLSLVGNGRDRNLISDQRLDTLVHMQGNDIPNFSGVKQPGAWEIAIPNGLYQVFVSVGDAGTAVNSSNCINIEGQPTIVNFVPTSSTHFSNATVTVSVNDGRLTIDANGGTNTKINYVTVTNADVTNRPSVTSSSPANNATGILRDTAVTAEVHLPNTGFGIDPDTLTSQTVKLQRTSNNSQVPATLNTSGGGDVIVLDPSVLLDSNTSYTFQVTEGLKDLSGAAFVPYTSSFTTGSSSSGTTNSPASFEKVTLPTASGSSFTSVTMGPDGKLYAGTIEGEIVRFPLNPDGTTGTPQVITSLQTANGGQRMLIGLAFDPASTATNLILWVSHSAYAFNSAPDWSGKITRLSGSDLTTVQDYVINLPRSIRDHMTNSIAFGPDGALYFTQGSNTSMGAPDDAWGLRPEHVLTAAVLRLNRSAVTSPPLNALTPDGGGTYNPFAAGAPLTIYASGTRNAFDLVWHSNGQLYVPTNGAAAGGNTPNTPTTLPTACQNRLDGVYTGPQVPELTNVTVAQSDYLFRVVQGGYYGNPNPQRCEWVLNGGNPTNGADPAQVGQYPVGTQPDRNWRRFAFDFGRHYSPNGAIEYRSNVFNGALRGKLLVVRYSAGDDIIALTPGGSTLDIVAAETGITGFTDFQDPLDLVENTANGNLYVTEFAAQKITLLRPIASGGGGYTVNPTRLVYNTVQNTTSPAQSTIVTNTGSQVLTITGLSIVGTNPGQFQVSSQPTLPATIQTGSSATIGVVFKPTSTGPKEASLQIQTNDAALPSTNVDLRGLGTLGTGGTNEPSLQWILDTYDIPVNVGDPDPTNSSLPSTALIGDEVAIQRFQKANTGPITIEPIAVFGPSSVNPVLRFGWYASGNAASKQEMFTISNSFSQTLNPQVSGTTSFDPGAATFGFYSIWPFFNNREVFSEDSLNTFSGAIPHHVRVYPLKAADGSVISNSYLVATEEDTCCSDYQDIVVIVRNVKPSASGQKINVVNLDGVPFADRLAFSRIGGLTNPPANGVHDIATVRVQNLGTSTLQISGLQLAGSWAITNQPTLPANIAPGANLDLTLQFRATCCDVNNGTLTIMSNDPQQPNTILQLSGFWQSVSEGGQEPTLTELMSVFGYGTKITRVGEVLNQQGLVKAVGDEVLSPYWQRADTSKPVMVRQLNAYHTYPNPTTLYWYNKANPTLNAIFTLLGQDAQSVLPRINGTSNAPAAGAFTPATTMTFGFKIDGEWSDDTKNSQTADRNNGCPGPCGHHVRFWPVRDRQGKLVPHTWLMAMDYSGINYDYNDNAYLITNIKPENSALNPAATALYRLDVAGSDNYSDTFGRSWTTDAGFFSPSTAIDEGANLQPQEIAKTDDDLIYRTYRGNVGNVPLSQRVLTYNLATNGVQKVDLRLHFAERVWTAAGKRVFNIEAEGQVLRSSFDIFATAGSSNTALVLPFSNIDVTDGSLTLVLRAVVDYPSIAGIEVLCPSDCGNVGNILPSTAITSPLNNSTFTAPADITINANATDTDGSVSKVDFYANAAFIGTDTSAPYSFAWSNVGAGNYSLTAVATDNLGGSASSAAVNIAVGSSNSLTVKINFQPDSAPLPDGYTKDIGEAYDTTRGRGWVRQDSLTSPTHIPLSIVPNSRDRNLNSDQRLDTLMHMQFPTSVNNATAVKIPAAWEYALPTGTYTVTVAVGDAAVSNDSSNVINVEGVLAISNFVPTGAAGSSTRHAITSITVPVSDGNLTIDAIGGTNTKIDYVEITGTPNSSDTTPPAAPTTLATSELKIQDGSANEPKPSSVSIDSSVNVKINFQPDGAAVPSGYIKDIGDAYDPIRGRGWIREDSLSSATHLPLDIVPNSRDRNLNSDQRLDTLMHMQFPLSVSNSTAVKIPAAWEYALPNGDYTVTVAVGDAALNNNSNHVINVEGVRVINNFLPTGAAGTSSRHAIATATVTVSDGKLTIDAIAGTNTKIDFVDIATAVGTGDTTPPVAPTNLVSTSSSAGIVLDWSDNSEGDLAGYNIYRSASATGPFNKLNATLLTSSNYSDAAAPSGQTSFYQVTGVDTSGNESEPALTSATMPEAANFTTITWTIRAASPIARSEALGVAVDQKLYIFGGYTSSTSSTPTKRADVYDSVSNTWTQIKDLPTGLSHAGVASDGQNVYFAGGYPEKNGGGQTFATRAVWKYNVDTNSYTAMPALPQARGGGALVRLDRDLHFFGGSNADRADANTHWFLSLDNLSAGWFVAGPMLSATNHLGGAALGSLIYAVGGQKGQNEASVIQKSVQKWDPSTDTWKMVQNLPTPRGHIAGATFVMGGRIIVAGGEPAHGSTTRKVTAYNPAIDSWTELTPLPLARSSGVAGQVGSVIVYTTGSFTKTTYRGVPGS